MAFEYGPASGERANLGVIKGENIPDRGMATAKVLGQKNACTESHHRG